MIRFSPSPGPPKNELPSPEKKILSLPHKGRLFDLESRTGQQSIPIKDLICPKKNYLLAFSFVFVKGVFFLFFLEYVYVVPRERERGREFGNFNVQYPYIKQYIRHFSSLQHNNIFPMETNNQN